VTPYYNRVSWYLYAYLYKVDRLSASLLKAFSYCIHGKQDLQHLNAYKCFLHRNAYNYPRHPIANTSMQYTSMHTSASYTAMHTTNLDTLLQTPRCNTLRCIQVSASSKLTNSTHVRGSCALAAQQAEGLSVRNFTPPPPKQLRMTSCISLQLFGSCHLKCCGCIQVSWSWVLCMYSSVLTSSMTCSSSHSTPRILQAYKCIRLRTRWERWGAGVETQKNVLGEVGGWGRVPFNEPYAPSLSTIYDGA